MRLEVFHACLACQSVPSPGRPVTVLKLSRGVLLSLRCKQFVPAAVQGQYVLVFTARKARLPSMWIMGAYRTLPRWVGGRNAWDEA